MARIALVKAMPSAFGCRPRFAMKACPTAAVLQMIWRNGIEFDAGSVFEARRALRLGIPASAISLTSQELPDEVDDLLEAGVWINATSLSQLERLCLAKKKHSAMPEVGLRVNPGLGSGATNRTNVGGPASSFGLWWEYVEQAQDLATRCGAQISVLHTHVGSGADPVIWEHCVGLALRSARQLPAVRTLNLGGGFKVARMPSEQEADLQVIGKRVADSFHEFASETGRQLQLEIEPGAYLMAPAGAILARVIDVVDTGAKGRRFIKLDTGMTEILRPALYGAQHPLDLLPQIATAGAQQALPYLVVGHCCESGDILTPAAADPEGLLERPFVAPKRGDLMLVGSAGAYTSGMAATNYNSFPQAAELLLETSGSARLVRRRQTLEQIMQNEIFE